MTTTNPPLLEACQLTVGIGDPRGRSTIVDVDIEFGYPFGKSVTVVATDLGNVGVDRQRQHVGVEVIVAEASQQVHESGSPVAGGPDAEEGQ